MRKRTVATKTAPYLTLLTAFALVATPLAAFAGAQGNSGNAGNQGANDSTASNGHGGAEEAKARVQELKGLRQRLLDSFHETRRQVLEDYRAELDATRKSYLENKTRVIEECQAQHGERMENGYAYEPGDDEALGHCIRDGLQPLKEEARAAMKDAREDAVAALKAAVKSRVQEWKDGRAEILARYRGSGDETTA